MSYSSRTPKLQRLVVSKATIPHLRQVGAPDPNSPVALGTTQACLFRDEFSPLTATGYSIFGLSSDSPKSNTTFKTKQNLPYTLLCDPNATLIAAIGMRKAPKGTVRGVFVVSKAGRVEAIEPGVSTGMYSQRLSFSLTPLCRDLQPQSRLFEDWWKAQEFSLGEKLAMWSRPRTLRMRAIRQKLNLRLKTTRPKFRLMLLLRWRTQQRSLMESRV